MERILKSRDAAASLTKSRKSPAGLRKAISSGWGLCKLYMFKKTVCCFFPECGEVDMQFFWFNCMIKRL